MPSFADREMRRFGRKELVLAEAAKCLEVLTQGSFVKEVKRLGYSPYSQELLEVLRAINDLESQYPGKKTNKHLGAMSEQISKSDILNSVSVDAYVVLRRYASAEVIQQLGLAVGAHETVQKYSMVQKKAEPFLDAERAFLNILEDSSPALVASFITSGIESTISPLMTLYTESPWGNLTSLRTDNKGKDRSQEVVAEVRHQAHELLTEVPSPEVLGRVLSDVELFLVDNLDNLAKFIEEHKLKDVGQLLNALKVGKIDNSFFAEALKTYCLKNKIALDGTGSIVALLTALKQRASQEQAVLDKQERSMNLELAYLKRVENGAFSPVTTDAIYSSREKKTNDAPEAIKAPKASKAPKPPTRGGSKAEFFVDYDGGNKLKLSLDAPLEAKAYDVSIRYIRMSADGTWKADTTKVDKKGLASKDGRIEIMTSLPYNPKSGRVIAEITTAPNGQRHLKRVEFLKLDPNDSQLKPSEQTASYFNSARLINVEPRNGFLVAKLAVPSAGGPFNLKGNLFREAAGERTLANKLRFYGSLVGHDGQVNVPAHKLGSPLATFTSVEVPIYPPFGDDLKNFVAVFSWEQGGKVQTFEIPGYELAKVLK